MPKIDYRYGVNPTSGVSPIAYTRADSATRTIRGGLVEVVPASRFRTHWTTDTVGTRRGGLLVEGARTNLALRSEEFDNAYWVKTAITASANQALSPDGALTGDKLTEDATTSVHRVVSGSITISASSTYTASAYVKITSPSRYFLLSIDSAFNQHATLGFDLSTETVLSGFTLGYTNVSGTIRDAGGGWYRCTVTATSAAGVTTTTLSAGLTNATTWVNAARGFPSYLGDGTSGFFIWGAQLELGSFASTYIPTVASTVTRATDQVSYANFPQPAEIAARGGMTVYWAGVDLGTRDTEGARLVQVGSGGINSRVLEVRTFPVGSYRVAIGNGSANTAVACPAPAAGVHREVFVEFEYRLNGSTPELRNRMSVYSGGALAAGTSFSSWLDATALIANGWQTSPTLYVGARDGGNNPGFALHQQLKTAFGVQTIDEMRALV
jgi:hypothetical protein